MVLLSDKFMPIFFPSKLFPKKITAISNFISDGLIKQEVDMSEKKREVLFVGRLDNKQKRIDLLLQIWSKVEGCANDWILNICGAGQDESMLKQMKEDLGLRNVYFRGFVKPEDYYKTASVFCMTSAFEGFGLVLAEAAAFGCVPIAFDSFEAVHDLITDGENGRLIKAFDVDAYAKALKELMGNEDVRMRLAANAKRDVKRFDPDKIMDEWERLFDEVMNK
jgi:glycosyltransferase involved in cell wall biosynthesis